MKSTMLLICFAFIITSCGSKKNSDNNSAFAPAEKTGSSSGLNKEGTQANHVVKVTKVEDYNPDGVTVPPGSKLVAVQVEYYNAYTDRAIDVSPADWVGYTNNGDGHVYNDAIAHKEPALKDASVPAGGRLSAWVTFQIPTDTKLVKAEYDNDLTEEKAVEIILE